MPVEAEETTLLKATLLKPEGRRKTLRIVVALAATMTALAVAALPSPVSAVVTTAPVARDPIVLCPPLPTPTSYLPFNEPETLPYYAVFGDYGVANHNNYWSVLATQGNQYINSDVSLLRNTTCGPTSALDDPMAMDWIAVDSNAGRVPTGMFVARFSGSRLSGTEAVPTVQFVDGHRTLATNTPVVAQPVGDDWTNWIVDIRDMYLYAGQTVRLVFSGPLTEMHVVGSDPARSSTWYRTSTTTMASRYFPYPPQNPQDGSLEVTAPWSGWYGVVVGRRYESTGPTTLYITTL